MKVYFTTLVVLVCLGLGCKKTTAISWNPKEGYVPNQTTAIKIDEAVWLNIYGKGIEKDKPFVAN